MFDEPEPRAEPVRLPGLYRAWEIGCLIETERRYSVEGVGATLDGAPLFAVYAITHDADRVEDQT
ncbi:hypothetical protein OEZ60_13080 [Defluviimonas sp. WL0024]|uniref:Uncharacterized protein n=1 Tax=Albidovulum salinarum TaxID=2984153 RepID=A0ABT2X4S2_9RHOB|nr:hypothetical protein [Defluviimonas sp. WL0024]MCU9848938.1 hypothetical protein [Defluviimonas sp. WL0024]